MNASATSTIASSRHPRKDVTPASERSTYIEKLRKHLLLPRHLPVHITELYVGTGSTRTSHIYGKVDASGRPYWFGICVL